MARRSINDVLVFVAILSIELMTMLLSWVVLFFIFCLCDILKVIKNIFLVKFMKQVIVRGSGLLLTALGVVASSGNASAQLWLPPMDEPWIASSRPFLLPDGSIWGIIQNITFWLLAVLGFFGIIGFVIAGIFYLIAAGDEDQAKKGKNGLKWSITGIIVALLGFVILQAVTRMLNALGGF